MTPKALIETSAAQIGSYNQEDDEFTFTADQLHAFTQQMIGEIEAQRDELLAASIGLMQAHRITVGKPPQTVMQAERQIDVIRDAAAKMEAAISNVTGGVQ